MTLRLARGRDLAPLGELLRRQGIDPDELDLARLVRFDPLRRLVICATALVGSAESVVGVGALNLGADVGGGESPVPSLVVVDQGMTEGLAELISEALVGRAQALAQGRAA